LAEVMEEMNNEHTLSGLLRKRAELVKALEHAHTVVRRLVIDLDNLDATIRLFEPGAELEEVQIKPLPPRHAAFQGEVARIILGILRDAGQPMTTHDLTLHVMANRGMNTADVRLVKLMTKRVGSCLRHHRGRGTLRSQHIRGELAKWEVV
jgi:hypothetical protein